jgi:Rieske Fe-S protein
LNGDTQQKEDNLNKISSQKHISRRGFLGSVLALWSSILAMPFIYSFIEYLSPPRKKFRSHNERMNPESQKHEIALEKIPQNSSVYVKVDDEPVLLIRGEGDKILAYSAICTHLDCLVGYRKSNNDIFCNCHSSSFNIDGFPVDGPAKKPLTRYKTEVKNGIIYVSNLIP